MPAKSTAPTAAQIATLRRRVRAFYRKHGRRLPFRETRDPYKITVAEVMLQQTQVDRVVPFWQRWIDRWPDWQSVARATPHQLLTMWSGLGYNRRALYLGKLARTVVEQHGGVLPRDPQTLLSLPGIGPYTSRAILIFAFNEPYITIDTNIRRVILFELGLPPETSAKRIEEIAWQLLPKRRSREWHNALMDYSALALPRRIAALPPRSRQSKFEGSLRQIRGEIIRQLVAGKRVTLKGIQKATARSAADARRAAESLVREGTIVLASSGRIRLA